MVEAVERGPVTLNVCQRPTCGRATTRQLQCGDRKPSGFCRSSQKQRHGKKNENRNNPVVSRVLKFLDKLVVVAAIDVDAFDESTKVVPGPISITRLGGRHLAHADEYYVEFLRDLARLLPEAVRYSFE